MTNSRLGIVLAAGLLIGIGSFGPSSTAFAQATKKPTEVYNLADKVLAIDGYDPVAYFPEGGGKPAKGDEKITFLHNGVTYRFASAKNMEAFKANPAKYEPAHGGWCSYAMGNDGTQVEIDPKSFLISDGRLFLFYKDWFTDTRDLFIKKQAALTKKADENWKKLSGEAPRDGKAMAKPEMKPEMKGEMASSGKLSEKLDALKQQYATKAPAEMTKAFEDGVREVAMSGAVERAMKVGATAPDFTLPDATGKQVALSEMLKQGPVVLTWYRGAWCPYCNLQLRAYQDALPEMKAMGAQLIAVSPQLPSNDLTSKEKQELAFAVLSDAGNTAARQYGLVYRMPKDVQTVLTGKLDLPKLNGDNSWELPLAATYIIGTDRKVTYAFVDSDYRKRAEPEAILAALKAMKAKG